MLFCVCWPVAADVLFIGFLNNVRDIFYRCYIYILLYSVWTIVLISERFALYCISVHIFVPENKLDKKDCQTDVLTYILRIMLWLKEFNDKMCIYYENVSWPWLIRQCELKLHKQLVKKRLSFLSCHTWMLVTKQQIKQPVVGKVSYIS